MNKPSLPEMDRMLALARRYSALSAARGRAHAYLKRRLWAAISPHLVAILSASRHEFYKSTRKEARCLPKIRDQKFAGPTLRA